MVSMLAPWLLWIVRPGLYQGSEIADSIDFVLTVEESAAEFPEVQPLVRGPRDRAVVEIKPIDINVDSHLPRHTQKPPEGGFAPGRRSNRGVY